LVDAWIRVDVSRCPGLVDPGVLADARCAHIPGGAGLVDPGIPADARGAYIPRGAGLVDSRIPMDVSGRSGLVDATIARMQHRGHA
jgi:hypothetical protein